MGAPTLLSKYSIYLILSIIESQTKYKCVDTGNFHSTCLKARHAIRFVSFQPIIFLSLTFTKFEMNLSWCLQQMLVHISYPIYLLKGKRSTGRSSLAKETWKTDWKMGWMHSELNYQFLFFLPLTFINKFGLNSCWSLWQIFAHIIYPYLMLKGTCNQISAEG